jgi:DNA-binding transcriptional LysR family regulator
MVAVRVSRDHRLAVVGSPSYFASQPKPNSPHELTNHRCINLRGGSAGPYRWEFEKDGVSLAVDVNGPLIVDDADLMIRAAMDGLGSDVLFRRVCCAPDCQRGARACPGRLVSAVRWLLPLLSEPPAAAGRDVSAYRDAQDVERGLPGGETVT